jgi:hypothetical protein
MRKIKLKLENENTISETAFLPTGTTLEFQPTKGFNFLIVPFTFEKEIGPIFGRAQVVTHNKPLKLQNESAPGYMGYLGIKTEKDKYKKAPNKEKLIDKVLTKLNIPSIYYIIKILEKIL